MCQVVNTKPYSPSTLILPTAPNCLVSDWLRGKYVASTDTGQKVEYSGHLRTLAGYTISQRNNTKS